MTPGCCNHCVLAQDLPHITPPYPSDIVKMSVGRLGNPYNIMDNMKFQLDESCVPVYLARKKLQYCERGQD